MAEPIEAFAVPVAGLATVLAIEPGLAAALVVAELGTTGSVAMVPN